mgnify:CR=1 FL=1
MKISNGWLEGGEQLCSPNCNARPENQAINLLVIHCISLPPAQFDNSYIEDFFLNKLPVADDIYFNSIKDLQVSSHFLIKRTGEVIQFVSCDDRAWHAGKSCFQGRENCNDFSIGIELQGTEDINYCSEQYQSLASLTKAIQAAYPLILAEHIVGHEFISPGRKTDPGKSFNWARYKKSTL